ncbi:Chaperone protein DnaJ, partial [Geodia barretti]
MTVTRKRDYYQVLAWAEVPPTRRSRRPSVSSPWSTTPTATKMRRRASDSRTSTRPIRCSAIPRSAAATTRSPCLVGTNGSGFDGFENFGGFGDIFDAFFGGSTRRSATSARRGADLQVDITIDFEKASSVPRRRSRSVATRSARAAGAHAQSRSRRPTPAFSAGGPARYAEASRVSSASSPRSRRAPCVAAKARSSRHPARTAAARERDTRPQAGRDHSRRD